MSTGGSRPLPTPKRPEKPSAGRRTLELLASETIRTGAASSYEDLLDQVAAVHGRKLFNSLLAILQMPHASMMCSAPVWEQKWGRRIGSGQRPLVLLARFGPVEFVYDVSQTELMAEVRPLPIDAAPFAMAAVVQSGELLERLIGGVAESGVRVVRSRQGVALAGKIERVSNLGDVAGTGVPVRWVVTLNETHSPTEQLATISHELGHLFCGHVGADEGDAWPVRDESLDDRTREFEAESVARLVFGRIAPRAELPPYLDHILLPGEPVPDHGWSYVAKAADRVLDLLGVESEPTFVIDHLVGSEDRPVWGSDLIIRRGGPGSLEVVLIQAWDLHIPGLATQIAQAWSHGTRPALAPWVVLVQSERAMAAVDQYYGHARGEQAAHDDYMTVVESYLPLADHSVTFVRRAPQEQAEDVVLTADPAGEGGIFVTCSEQLVKRGLDCVAHEADRSWMYHHYSEAGGASWGEQTLGWDDMFTDEHWRSLEQASRLFVSLKMIPTNVTKERLAVLAAVVTGQRAEYHNFINGYEDGDPAALAHDPFSETGQSLLF